MTQLFVLGLSHEENIRRAKKRLGKRFDRAVTAYLKQKHTPQPLAVIQDMLSGIETMFPSSFYFQQDITSEEFKTPANITPDAYYVKVGAKLAKTETLGTSSPNYIYCKTEFINRLVQKYSTQLDEIKAVQADIASAKVTQRLDYSGDCNLAFVNELRDINVQETPLRILYAVGQKLNKYHAPNNPTPKNDGIYEVLIVRAERNLNAIKDSFPPKKGNFPILEAVVNRAKTEVTAYKTLIK